MSPNLYSAVLLFLLCSFLNGQDTLITTTGMKYVGNLIDSTNTSIIFKMDSNKNPQTIPRHIISEIRLLDGVLTYNKMLNTDQLEMKKKERNVSDGHISKFVPHQKTKDEVTTHSGKKHSGLITSISSVQIEISSNNGYDVMELPSDSIRSIVGTPWLLILADSIIVTGQLTGIRNDTLFFVDHKGTHLTYPSNDLLVSYHLKPAGTEGDWNDYIINYFPEKRMNDSEYELGLANGRNASKGSYDWFFKGLFMNTFGPLAAKKITPRPSPELLAGESKSYIAGFIVGYGEESSRLNTLYSSFGCAINSCTILFIALAIEIGRQDPWMD